MAGNMLYIPIVNHRVDENVIRNAFESVRFFSRQRILKL